jgi:hypothetical protein
VVAEDVTVVRKPDGVVARVGRVSFEDEKVVKTFSKWTIPTGSLLNPVAAPAWG